MIINVEAWKQVCQAMRTIIWMIRIFWPRPIRIEAKKIDLWLFFNVVRSFIHRTESLFHSSSHSSDRRFFIAALPVSIPTVLPFCLAKLLRHLPWDLQWWAPRCTRSESRNAKKIHLKHANAKASRTLRRVFNHQPVKKVTACGTEVAFILTSTCV